MMQLDRSYWILGISLMSVARFVYQLSYLSPGSHKILACMPLSQCTASIGMHVLQVSSRVYAKRAHVAVPSPKTASAPVT